MKRILSVLVLVIVTTGCAVQQQQPIAYSEATLPTSTKVGIAVSVVPEVKTTYPGADCLLCLAAAATANGKLSKHVATLSAEDLAEISPRVEAKLVEMGFDPVVIESPLMVENLPKNKNSAKVLNPAKKDFTYFKETYDVDYLVAVELGYVGVIRNYASYVPTSDPQALILGKQYVVKIDDNSYTWFKPLNFYRSADGEWKEPPTYPGLTNAFYQAIESVLDEVVNTDSGKINEGEILDENTGEIKPVESASADVAE